MLRVQREMTDVEMIDALDGVIDIIIDSYNQPIREDFKKLSRSAQIGYDIQRYLLDHKLIRVGGVENG